MSTAIVKEIFDVDVIRTRDKEILDTLDLVYDVGGGEYDHHDIEKVYRESGTPYAACGLIWRRFGREVVQYREPSLNVDEIDEVYRNVDEYLIEGIDATDNGLKTYDTIIPTVCISSVISGFNPTWDKNIPEDEAFNKAVDVASNVLRNTINQKVSEIRARKYIIKAFENRAKPELLILDNSYPWTHTLQEIDKNEEVLFVIFPRDNQYLIQTVRGSDGADRKKLPKSWAGKRDEALNNILGIEDAVFCHPGRFIAGAKSYDSILKMAEIAVNEPYDEEEKIKKPEDNDIPGKVKKSFLRRRILIRM